MIINCPPFTPVTNRSTAGVDSVDQWLQQVDRYRSGELTLKTFHGFSMRILADPHRGDGTVKHRWQSGAKILAAEAWQSIVIPEAGDISPIPFQNEDEHIHQLSSKNAPRVICMVRRAYKFLVWSCVSTGLCEQKADQTSNSIVADPIAIIEQQPPLTVAPTWQANIAP